MTNAKNIYTHALDNFFIPSSPLYSDILYIINITSKTPIVTMLLSGKLNNLCKQFVMTGGEKHSEQVTADIIAITANISIIFPKIPSTLSLNNGLSASLNLCFVLFLVCIINPKHTARTKYNQ